ncbi:hypothetical protein E2C01_026403 [Portunus trituberculatus]|uniref:Down syndrome cell adhesion molecule-like protein Dscam2 n=1 Tax=Portunus trituberculatus TaxID=210409 RepID=A0A5B7EKV3_PORTR|nr:hypothetical protein [Portunus trituberculatus]
MIVGADEIAAGVTVVAQPYETRVSDEFVIRGNAAILKCSIPSFVADFVTVQAWITDDSMAYYPSRDYGTPSAAAFLLILFFLLFPPGQALVSRGTKAGSSECVWYSKGREECTRGYALCSLQVKDAQMLPAPRILKQVLAGDGGGEGGGGQVWLAEVVWREAGDVITDPCLTSLPSPAGLLGGVLTCVLPLSCATASPSPLVLPLWGAVRVGGGAAATQHRNERAPPPLTLQAPHSLLITSLWRRGDTGALRQPRVIAEFSPE